MIDAIIQNIVILAIPLLFAITLHEVAHGWVASYFGDQTARLAGRLSFNPIKHIDLVGTILIPFTLLILTNFRFTFGWAKPVPVDGRNMRNPRRDMAIVAFAGPFTNFLMALFWGLMARGGAALEDGGNAWVGVPLNYMGLVGVQINIVLAVLNLIPLPPLDGSKILMSLLPPRVAYRFSFIEPYSFLILILLLVTGILSTIMMPLVLLLIKVVTYAVGL